MSQDYNKTLPDEFNIKELQDEINSSQLVTPSCLSITNTTGQIGIFTFASSLSVDEESALDNIIENHVPVPEVIGVNKLPVSYLDSYKLAVHSSSKPQKDIVTYAIWTGSGDNTSDPENMWGGELLDYQFPENSGGTKITKIVEFNRLHGGIWIHEASLKFDGGGPGDYIEGIVCAYATVLQTSANLDLNVDADGWITYAGAGLGTHGFAGPESTFLVPRTFSKDGQWDYDLENGLVPNMDNTGEFKLRDTITPVHKYYNKIPCNGSNMYYTMTSDDTAELPPGYFIDITAHNNSGNAWSANVVIEVYRERTLNP